ncbi:MAG: hypothetical protein M1839_006704 [Geoglossum umbratile]|nr:MAG: hypothetical protein M1839_006704 [Geoglossum umbratile]
MSKALTAGRQWRNASTRELDAAKRGRTRIVILGSGWAGYTLSRKLDPRRYQVLVISPRSYFVFTPLLASTAVGTLEFRNAVEPIRRRGATAVEFYQGWADKVDFSRRIVTVEENIMDTSQPKPHNTVDESVKKYVRGQMFDVSYDKLVVAVGCYSQTFGIPGVRENALFLKDVGDARKIRTRILECFEKAALPYVSEQLKSQLLHFAIVGGGPTGIEFSAELHDLIADDLAKLYPSLTQYTRITVYDVAPRVLSMFDSKLAEYAVESFFRAGIDIRTARHVEGLSRGVLDVTGTETERTNHGCLVLRTKEDGEVGVGACIWSTGLMKNPFLERFAEPIPHSTALVGDDAAISAVEKPGAQWKIREDGKTGRIITDNRLRIKVSLSDMPNPSPQFQTEAVLKDVFALGDCGTVENATLPATAQVANQEAVWLSKRFNKGDLETNAFSYNNLGVMAYIGGWKAIMQSGGDREVKGRTAWLLWRTAYMTMAVSLRNKVLIPIYW